MCLLTDMGACVACSGNTGQRSGGGSKHSCMTLHTVVMFVEKL